MELVSWDDDIPNMMGKIKAMFQTTNQLILVGALLWKSLFIHNIGAFRSEFPHPALAALGAVLRGVPWRGDMV